MAHRAEAGIQLPPKIRQHLTNWRRWNKRKKFEAASIFFLSDIFVAVAVVVALKLAIIIKRHFITMISVYFCQLTSLFHL